MSVRRSSFRFCVLALMSCVALTAPPVSFASIDKQHGAAITAALADGQYDDFDAFLEALEDSPLAAQNNLTAIIEQYRSGTELDYDQQIDVQRLLGLYARVKYGEQALQMLIELVAIPTFNVESVPQYENPEFHRFAAKLESIANDFNLAFRNVEDRVYEISLGETGKEVIGIHAHADVVPVNPDLWSLPDGTKLDPFKVTRVGNQMFGRGTQDDKNGIVVSMYAMKIIKEENLPLLRDFKLLVDTTEETSGEAMPHYFESNPVPEYNIAVDGSYPVVIAEKGVGTVMASFPVRKGSGEGAEIVNLVGGLANNQIPSTATALIITTRPAELIDQLNSQGAVYAATHGSNFTVNAAQDGTRVRLDVLGVSAHSSEPETGVNPVSRLFDFVNTLYDRGVFQSNHFTDAASYATENWGLDYYGNTLQIAYTDDFMGPLTTAQTFIRVDDSQLRAAVNLRLPVGRAPDELMDEVSMKLDKWVQDNDIDVTLKLSAGAPMFRNPEGAWVNALLDIAVENLDIPREFGSSAGATSIHSLPNGVQFGLAMANEKYTGHNANEFKTVDQFLLDLQIITEVFARLGSMPSL